MIHLITGQQGSGKTLFLVKMAYEAYLKGKTIYSNVALRFPYKPLDYKDIIECRLQNAIVILDEIHLLLPARRSMKHSSVAICDGFLSMVRKKGLEVYGTTQTIRKVDIRFREECDYYYTTIKYAMIKKGKFERIFHNENLNRNIPLMIKINVTETYSNNTIEISFLGNKYFKLFDTNQVIKVKGLE